ncbi:MAG: septum formation initiator family protein [Kordiimonadaceae bacterium]|nr:septum formation initiator family protein [Kordiimonadaceae bacterium]MBO6570302.1 septum formation initiator family protein [Kordiimonadaceae bacterium]MBO6965600.1 septum formation initiator family protein [Kordiimonadaceae bacterium]
MIRIMRGIGNIINGVGRNWMAGFWLFLVAYFVYHAFHGDNSIHALRSLQQQELELQAIADKVRQKRTFLETQTRALNHDAVDPDMLEEQVRTKLGFVHSDEVIILLQ